MTAVKEQAVRIINELSDDTVKAVIEILRRLAPQDPYEEKTHHVSKEEKLKAFEEINIIREEILKSLPAVFDPKRELDEAREERYGSAG